MTIHHRHNFCTALHCCTSSNVEQQLLLVDIMDRPRRLVQSTVMMKFVHSKG